MNPYVYDIETYPNCFTMAVKRLEDGREFEFEISGRQNDCEEIKSFCKSINLAEGIMVGFNNIGFDYPVLHMLLASHDVTALQLH